MKKISSLVFILSFLISACGATATPADVAENNTATSKATRTPKVEPTAVVASKLPVKAEALKGLDVTVWYPWYGVEASLFESLVKEFNEKNQWGIKIDAAGQVNFTNLYENVKASLPTANKPDMVIALPENALEWNENRIVTNLTPYVQDPAYGIDSSDIPSVFWNQDVTADDVRVAVPAQRTARFLLWNETWAGVLGFDAPPKDSDAFRQQACRAQQSMLTDAMPQNDSLGGWLVDTDPMTAYAWLLAFDGGVLEGNSYRFLAPNNIQAFTYLRQLSESTCSWQTADANVVQAFATRQALFVTASLQDLPNVARELATQNNTDKWKVIPFPGTDQDAFVIYGSSYVILNSTQEKQLASWLFIRWLLDKQQDARWVQATHLFPLRESTLDLLTDYKKTHPQWQQAVDLLPQGKIEPQLASWRIVKVMLGDGFSHMYRVNIPSGQVAAILAQMESISHDLSQ